MSVQSKGRDWKALLESALERGLRVKELAREVGCNSSSVYDAERRYGITLPRREETGTAYTVEPYVPDGTEQWRVIPGFSRFEVSSLGRFRRADTGRIRATAWNARCRYWCIQLRGDDGALKTAYVHRWVAKTFLSNPDAKTQVNHKNSNRSDNSAVNLEWTTRAENYWHGQASGLAHRAGNPRIPSKLTPEKVVELKTRRAAGERLKDLAAEFGIDANHAWKIMAGTKRRHG